MAVKLGLRFTVKLWYLRCTAILQRYFAFYMSTNFKFNSCRNFLISIGFIISQSFVGLDANASCATGDVASVETSTCSASMATLLIQATGGVNPAVAGLTTFSNPPVATGAAGSSGINNDGNTLSILTNNGVVSGGQGGPSAGQTGGAGGVGINNSSTGAITTLNNSNQITGGAGGTALLSGSNGGAGGTAIYNNGNITTLSNLSSGFISGGNGTSLLPSNYGNAGRGGDGISNASTGNVGTLSNAGTILGGNGGSGNLSNGGVSAGFGVSNSGSISTFTNSGGISGGNGGSTLTSGTAGSGASGFVNYGTITTLTNTGTFSGGLKGTGGANNPSDGFGIINNLGYPPYSPNGIITTLNNLQGAGNSAGALTYTGTLPTNYNIIINSPTSFGKLAVTGGTGTTAFGIYTGSTLSAATYSSVLTGLSSSNITNYSSIFNTWNNFNSSYKWELVQGGSATTWDLVVAARASNIQSGSTNLLSSVGGGLNPVLDGGILKVDSATTTSTAFTIKSTGGTIDANGLRTIFSGAFSDASGESGKLTITNTGTAGQGVVVLSTANTHSGGTEVQAGAALSIASSDALGSGTLALVGSSTVPATLTTTATTTIANAITVTGDPVFNVAPTTTTTITSPITDGVSAGDVVVAGGGTLALTAVNTYTGLTNINAGSTLALSGSGAIATSSSVTNNGTLNTTGKTGNVSIANYTQGSTGNLAMSVSPSNTQKLLVTGSASLAGGLSLAGSAGTYSAGKYALLTANGVSGTFGSFSSNLSSLTRLSYSLAYDANDVYLVFTPNTADTQQSLVNTASALQNTFALQNAVLANSFSYDCNVFGENDVCVSAGGRNTAVSAANGLNNTSALLIAAYKVHPQIRIGAYADQNLSMNNGGSTVNLGNNTPLIGLFGAWNERLDGTGTEVKVSAAYGQKNTTVTRQVVGTSEPGSGSSQLNSQGAQITAKYGFGVTTDVIVSPYVGIRYTQNNMGGYTEGASATVTAPLTYSALNTNATTAFAGVGTAYQFIPKATIYASAGVETDTNTSNGTYSATGVTGLTPINFNANLVRTRPTATVGAYYDIEKNQRLGITGIYRQEPYQAVQTTTVMATYTIGLQACRGTASGR